jgi:hypothetical protein
MSDNWLRFIPADPEYQPSAAAAERAGSMLRAFAPEADEVCVAFKQSVGFFDPGENWSGVMCPRCGTDVETWWHAAMDSAWQGRFADLSATTACCGARLSLNELRYPWPAGFGRFVLEAKNPNIAALTPDEMALLTATLGCELRQIWVHI